jgi:hypothetical protein
MFRKNRSRLGKSPDSFVRDAGLRVTCGVIDLGLDINNVIRGLALSPLEENTPCD